VEIRGRAAARVCRCRSTGAAGREPEGPGPHRSGKGESEHGVSDDLKYSREHEWVLVEGKVATVGITAFAEEQLGDVVFVELPAVGDKVTKDEAMGVVESVKAVSDVYAPVSGTVTEVNDDLPRTPSW
jgi:glycine cleavage system H lipoate-binding protein